MFGKKTKESQEVFVSLSHKHITVAYEENSELKVDSREFNIQSDINELIKFWDSGIKEIFEDVEFKPHLHLLINSSSFLVKNIQDRESMDEKYEYISKQIDTPRGFFEITKIRGNSYLIVENSDVEKILFAFKDYHITKLHDLSIINSLYFLTRKSELYLNISLSGVDAIFNGKIFQKRGLNSLFIDYLQKSANRLNLDLDSAYTHIKKSFINISSYDELVKSTQNGATDLRAFVDDLVEYIESTLGYFKNYDMLEQIDTLYLDGDVLELDFITHMLKDRLGLDNIVLANDFLKMSSHRGVASTIAYRVDDKVLKSSTIPLDGLRYSDGKQEYIFVDNSLVVQKKLTKEQKKRVFGFNRVLEAKKRVKEQRSSSGGYERPDKSIWKMDGGELFDLIKSKFDSNSSTNQVKTEGRDKFEDMEEEGEDETVKIIFLAILMCGVGAYYLWSYILDLEKNFKRRVDTYQTNMKSVDIAKEKLSNNQVIFVDDGINKIIWTEKFITIAKSMPNEIWFTSMRLENTEKEIEGKKVTSNRVVLDGRCLPSSVGHINTIATYMEKLMSSDKNFRRDFINISFGGAESMFDDMERNLIRFQLYCNFRRNVNIRAIEIEKDTKDNSIADNIKSIKKSAKKKEEILNNIGKKEQL
jgi:hypothetical protein